MDRKKELKQQYLQMKPEMGIYIIRSRADNLCLLEATQNLKSAINSSRFKLGAGNHPNREIQKAWKDLGEEEFTIEILEKLEYDEDESKSDYTEDLALLKLIWEERLKKENAKLI